MGRYTNHGVCTLKPGRAGRIALPQSSDAGWLSASPMVHAGDWPPEIEGAFWPSVGGIDASSTRLKISPAPA
ncbi:MAG: hypothetical protein M2R45_05181 [Verrucomicrobia subdivision 3 bacterium]|nr:hypothetical protein [Limisphaerales bacterium]